MGDITLTQMWTQIHNGMAQRSEIEPGTVDGENRLTDAINAAYLHVSDPSVYEHPELQAQQDIPLVAGTRIYNLAATVHAIEQVKIEESGTDPGVEIRRRSFHRINRSGTFPDARPSHYARRARTVHLDTTPRTEEAGRNLRVYHWALPARFVRTVPAAVTVIGVEWDRVLIVGARAYAWMDLGQPERADYHFSMFGALINDNGGITNIEGRAEGTRIEPRGGIQLGYQRRSTGT